MNKPFPDVERAEPQGPEIQDFGGIKAETWAKYPVNYPNEVKQALINGHSEEVVCSSCHEWTTRGDSCCGMSECDSDCPVCIEAGVFE